MTENTDARPKGEEQQQTDPVEALINVIDKHYDDDQCGAPTAAVVKEMLTDPTIGIGDVGETLQHCYHGGEIYQPSSTTLARVDTAGEEKTNWTPAEIEQWEDENDGVCPAFRVDHRPERQSTVTEEVDDGN